MPRVVILGGGFAGLSAAREFEERRKRVKDLDVVLVDRNNYMLFTPMLPEAATGNVEARHITEPFREQLKTVRFEWGDVLSVDEEWRNVTLRHPLTGASKTIAYDELVLSLGSTVSVKGVPGVERCAFQLRSLVDAERMRNAIIAAVEMASESDDVAERDRLLRFVIVGGGFTGVEAAGELSAFVRSILGYYPALRESMLSLVVVQSEKRLLPHLPDRFGKYAARVLHDGGVDIRIGADVDRVDPAGVTLKNGERFESRTVVWCAGTESAPIVTRLGLKTSKHGAVETRPDFSIEGHKHLWAIGDCAAIPKQDGGTYAPLAQNATREGPLLARNVIARLRGKRTKPFRYKTKGQMASLGDRHALAELPGGVKVTGVPAWILWRTYYLGRLPGVSRKTRVALDWALGLAFGRTDDAMRSFDKLRMTTHEAQ